MYVVSVLKDKTNSTLQFVLRRNDKMKRTKHYKKGGITTLDPCLVHARVSGGLPVQAQVNAASMPVSTVCGLGSDNSLGPTTEKKTRQNSIKKTHTIIAQSMLVFVWMHACS